MPNNTPLEIELSWQPVSGSVSYYIYLRYPYTGWTQIATVTAPTTTYIFNGFEDTEYMFAIRSWNGSYLSANAYINYPKNVSAIWTPPSITPTGLPMLQPYDIQYVTAAEFLLSAIAKGIGYNTSSPDYTDGTIDHALLKASATVNRYCRRYFTKMTIDEVYPNITIQVSNPRMTVVPLKYGPVQNINTIYIQVLKWFVPFALDYLIQMPEQRFYQIVPLISSAGAGSTGSPIPSVILEQSQLGFIWTNYTFGYDFIPEDIKHAVEILAGQELAMMKQNPMGASSLKTGYFSINFEASEKNPVLAEVKRILDPWRLHTLRMS